MNSVLVTGANGQLGQCLQEVAKKYPDIKWHFKTSTELDITNTKAIATVFKKNAYNYLINCAAYTAVDKAETEPEKAFLVNAEAVKLLAEACKTHNTTLIHISTDFVFDGRKTTPYTTNNLPNPISVYGASKLKGEQYVKEILSQYFIIRTSWMYSEYGNNFVKTMLRLGREHNELNVVNDQIGSPTYALDLAKFIVYLILNKSLNKGVYHYTDGGEISRYEFAIAIFKETNSVIPVNPIPTRLFPTAAKRPRYSVLDIKDTIRLGFCSLNWRERLYKMLINLSQQS